MLFEINPEFIVRNTDPENFSLIHRVKSKAGKDYEKTLGYFGTLQGALKNAMDNSRILWHKDSLKEAKDFLKDIENLIVSINTLK